MLVPLFVILKFLSRARNYFFWSSSKVEIFILWVSNVACEEFLQTLTLILCVACNSSVYTLVKGIRGGSIWDCTSVLTHWPLLMVYVLVYVDGVA